MKINLDVLLGIVCALGIIILIGLGMSYTYGMMHGMLMQRCEAAGGQLLDNDMCIAPVIACGEINARVIDAGAK